MGQPGDRLIFPAAAAAAAAANASNTGGLGVPSTSEALGFSQLVRPFETGSPSISPMLAGVDDTTPSSRRRSSLSLGGRDPFPAALAAVTGGMVERDPASNVKVRV